MSNLVSGAAADLLRDFESRLLQFGTFSPSTASRILEKAAAQDVSDCDNHSQRALLLLEIPLAEAALRSGSTMEYDRHMRSLEARTHRILGCSPRDSLVWLLAFGLDVQHGVLTEHSFDLLAMSYETSPNEAWVAVRRIVVAIPVVLAAPAPVQREILAEFQNLVRHRFVEMPARAYLNARAPIQDLLRSRLEELDQPSRKAFSDELDKLRS
jgi:hypothetical protein